MTPATIGSAAAAGGRTWDAIVIGAGPAGAVAARQAARGGASVLLVERKAFPRSKVCGGCLNAAALTLLSEIGLAGVVTGLGGTQIREFHVRCGGCDLILPLPDGLAVSRSRLDAALVGAAISAGADFLPETSATVGGLVGKGASESREVVLCRPGEGEVRARARVVLAADGLGHASLDAHPEFSASVPRSSRIGLGAVVAAPLGFYRQGTICMAVGPGGYVGLVRIEEQQLNVAAALDPAFIRSHGGAGDAVSAILADAGMPSVASLAAASWHGTLSLTRQSPRLAGRRLLLLGDAAGYVEPFTGEGMSWAMAAGAQSAPFVSAARVRWSERLEQGWSREMRRLVTRRQAWCRRLATALRYPRLSRWLLRSVAAAPVLARPIVGRLNSAPRVSQGAIG